MLEQIVQLVRKSATDLPTSHDITLKAFQPPAYRLKEIVKLRNS